MEVGAVTIRVDGWRDGSSHGVASMAYTMPGRRDAVDATPHRLDARATSFTHREFELYHFSRSPFARAFFSISSASSSSKNMSGLSARSGKTLSKLSVPSASAFAPAILKVAPSNIRASTLNCSFAPVYLRAMRSGRGDGVLGRIPRRH